MTRGHKVRRGKALLHDLPERRPSQVGSGRSRLGLADVGCAGLAEAGDRATAPRIEVVLDRVAAPRPPPPAEGRGPVDCVGLGPIGVQSHRVDLSVWGAGEGGGRVESHRRAGLEGAGGRFGSAIVVTAAQKDRVGGASTGEERIVGGRDAVDEAHRVEEETLLRYLALANHRSRVRLPRGDATRQASRPMVRDRSGRAACFMGRARSWPRGSASARREARGRRQGATTGGHASGCRL